jgi:hypothetical protein
MTVGVVWSEDAALWCAADTRISRPGIYDTPQRLTDHGPKLLSLPVLVRRPGASGLFTEIGSATTIGFLYAGAVSPALATHALCSAALQSLHCFDQSPPPELSAIATFIASCAERYMRNWAELNPQQTGWQFDALIFGPCQVRRELQLFALEAEVTDRIHVTAIRKDIDAPVIIGSGASDFRDRLEMLKRGGDPYKMTARFPLIAIESLTRDQTRDDVGGATQLGIATAAGFELYSRVIPIVLGKPDARQTFLGIDINELEPIDSCWFGMTGMA